MINLWPLTLWVFLGHGNTEHICVVEGVMWAARLSTDDVMVNKVQRLDEIFINRSLSWDFVFIVSGIIPQDWHFNLHDANDDINNN